MTWIVATPTRLGYAVALSDIRVTWSNGVEEDCLQKIYPVGKDLALGFAGSVRIGFRMLRKLRRLLRKSEAWTPEGIAEWWPHCAREAFQTSRAEEKGLKCELILVGIHPTEEIMQWAGSFTLLRLNNAPMNRSKPLPLVPKSFVYRFRSWEEFEPKIASDGEVVAIGCGSAVEPYKKLLAELSASLGDSGWASDEKGIGLGLWFNMTNQVKDFPERGISAHFHVCTVSRGLVEIVSGNHHAVGPMPLVTTTFKEFNDFEKSLRGAGISATYGAQC